MIFYRSGRVHVSAQTILFTCGDQNSNLLTFVLILVNSNLVAASALAGVQKCRRLLVAGLFHQVFSRLVFFQSLFELRLMVKVGGPEPGEQIVVDRLLVGILVAALHL